MSTAISSELIEIALERCEGWAFERFCNEFYASLEGTSFVPLGGTHDGGADGFEATYIGRNQHHFYQFSVREDTRTKIRQTIKRLKDFGRDPRVLTYVTSQTIQYVDNEEDELGEELNVKIRIRDAKYIASHVNNNIETISAYHNHLSSYTNFLKQIGGTSIIPKSAHMDDPSVYVFLEQEVNNRLGNTNLLFTVTDTLILWALNGTDPDKGIFLTRHDLLQKILDAIPWSKQFIRAHLDSRLEALASKTNTDGRQVSWFRKDDKFCLPYTTRLIIEDENLQDESLKLGVLEEFEVILSVDNHCDTDDRKEIANYAIETIGIFFEHEGLTFSYYLKQDNRNSHPNTVEDRIEEVLIKKGIAQDKYEIYRSGVRKILQKVFYKSTENQRKYLYHLSRTYILLFTLKAEPRIIDYFQGMTNNFKLYVGSDILIRGLTERYLDEPDQTVRNMLNLASKAGVELYLSEPILEEVITHIKATNYEFINHLSMIEPYVDRFIASQSNKILIRAYFYAKELEKVNGWKTFISQFVSYNKLETPEAMHELRQYLLETFSMQYVSKAEIKGLVNEQSVNELSLALMGEKTKQELAYNDALMVHCVYAKRRQNKESTSTIEYGYSTWWLTQETKIQKYTYELVKSNFARYIMRPEFLLSFFALSPKKVEVLNTFKTIFPTTIGLQMGHRMREETFHSILEKVREWNDLEPSRVKVKVGQLSDKLKADHMKRYDEDLNSLDNILKAL